ncbi:hypothetical protein N5923_16275 [Erwiniaceae bacterium BAC15a-03b]|uniref:Uncharacterized protein n=1 Tax=Winslowiella arboricola TaxID=2978220 RepID=A0A9J6PRM9_9GAMM|nr:hypothetical protein [Winslowiella arboricola]MCU5772521.1 hypothetical protein [Winslowiella arboricola]MCU5779043.1 hypothetical protein [Winslowiella arboricola]
MVKEGDKLTVICHQCGRSTATHRLRDVNFSDGSGMVKNILAGVCDRCDDVVSIPAQCTPQIKAAFEQRKLPLEVRVPAHYLDILHVATQKIDASLNEDFNKALILYYLHALTTGHYQQAQLNALLSSDFAQAKSSKRISMKVSPRQLEELNAIMQQQSMKKNSDVVKAVILKIHEDIIQEKNLAVLPELRGVAAAFG